MISALLRIRVSRLQLALVAVASAGASALIIAGAVGRTPAQSAADAALRHPPVEVRLAAPAPPAPAPAAPTPAAPTPTAPTPAPVAPAPVAASAAPSAPAPAAPAPQAPRTAATTSSTPATTPAQTTTAPTARGDARKLGHVFVIALTTTSFDAAFGSGSVARYLDGTLRRRGTLLGGYQTLGGAELPDYLAMVSGQAPNPDTAAECPTYAEFAAGAKPTPGGEVGGPGCVYPNTALTVADQVTAAGQSWRAYIGGIGRTGCPHPNSNAVDDAPPAAAGSGYSTRHNPFIYFHSLLDLGGCASNDVSLDRLPADLRAPSSTPRYAFIAPDVCLDASARTCPQGGPAGLSGEDGFLRQWVPRIMGSAAYRRDGALIIAFALAPSAGTPSPGTASPTVPAPRATSAPTGALVLSRYAARDKTVSTTYDPYSVLRTAEDLLGFKPLAHARGAGSFAAALLGR